MVIGADAAMSEAEEYQRTAGGRLTLKGGLELSRSKKFKKKKKKKSKRHREDEEASIVEEER